MLPATDRIDVTYAWGRGAFAASPFAPFVLFRPRTVSWLWEGCGSSLYRTRVGPRR